MSQTPIIIVCGPTASGKSMLGLQLAEAMDGEIVSADSMQVYIHMDIGTDKPAPETRKRIPHQCIDLVYPNQPFDAAQYRDVASHAIRTITGSGKRAFVVGGTGLYVKALVHGLFVCPPVSRDIRTKLEQEVKQKGKTLLYEELRQVDTDTAGRTHPNDSFRVLRALGVYRATGKPISELRRAHGFAQKAYRVLKLAIDVDRRELYHRVENRVDRMIAQGLVKEVEQLLSLGYGCHLNAMQSIGYRQIGAYLHGELSLDRAIELIKRDTRRYAKRQLTWFRGDSEICWLAGKHPEREAMNRVKNFLQV